MARRILAVLLAAALALLGTVAVLFYVRGADNRAVADANPVEVLVAKDRVPAGTTGEVIRKRGMVELVRLPAGSVPLNEVLDRLPEEFNTFVVTSDLQPGQLVLRRMFGQSTRTAGGLAIPEGKVAVSFSATMAEQVAGFVRPGAEVALFASYTLSADGRTRVAGTDGEGVQGTAVLLPRVEVIAIGPYGEGATTTTPIETEDGERDGTAQPVALVTVAVSANDAAKIIQVANASALYLALLNDSSQVQPGVGIDSRSLFG